MKRMIRSRTPAMEREAAANAKLSKRSDGLRSREWTTPMTPQDMNIGILGSVTSGKTPLVHRYLTGSYLQENCSDGGRFLKAINIGGRGYVLRIRTEKTPNSRFSSWVDAVILVFSVTDGESFNQINGFYDALAKYNKPIILVGTLDSLNEASPRVIDENAMKPLHSDLRKCPFYEACATTGLNVELIFEDLYQKVLSARISSRSSTSSATSTPTSSRRALTASPGIIGHESRRVEGTGALPASGCKSGMVSFTTPETPSPLTKNRKTNFFRLKKHADDKKIRDKDMENAEAGHGQKIPKKQGYLEKRCGGLNKKRHCAVYEGGIFVYFKTSEKISKGFGGKTIDLRVTTVRVPGRLPTGTKVAGPPPVPSGDSYFEYQFDIRALDNRQWVFGAGSAAERDEWVRAIEDEIQMCLSAINLPVNGNSKFGDKPLVDKSVVVDSLRAVPGNDRCADCKASNPAWASLNLGILICIECCGVHRQLGSCVSKVRSLDLDSWTCSLVKVMKSTGNQLANSLFEANLSAERQLQPDASREQREIFICAKYVGKEFIAVLPSQPPTIELLFDAIRANDMFTALLSLNHLAKDDLNAITHDHQTPLHLTAGTGHPVLTQLLIWRDANPNLLDLHHHTPLDYARAQRHAECTDILLQHGAVGAHEFARSRGLRNGLETEVPSPVVPFGVEGNAV